MDKSAQTDSGSEPPKHRPLDRAVHCHKLIHSVTGTSCFVWLVPFRVPSLRIGPATTTRPYSRVLLLASSAMHTCHMVNVAQRSFARLLGNVLAQCCVQSWSKIMECMDKDPRVHGRQHGNTGGAFSHPCAQADWKPRQCSDWITVLAQMFLEGSCSFVAYPHNSDSTICQMCGAETNSHAVLMLHQTFLHGRFCHQYHAHAPNSTSNEHRKTLCIIDSKVVP